MKTTMKSFLSYMIIIALVVFSSCKKDSLEDAVLPQNTVAENTTNSAGGTNGNDGTNGSDGTNGINGSDGTNGEDGEDGQDGADGATGPQGLAGLAGADGATGEQGERGEQGEMGPAGPKGDTGDAGEDGNANVTAIRFKSPAWENNGGKSLILDVPQITQDILNDGLVMGFIRFTGNDVTHFAIPGSAFPSGGNNFDMRVFLRLGEYHVKALKYDGSAFLNPPPVWEVKVLVIESTSWLAGKLNIADLKKMSYQEAMDYFGLED